MKMAATIALFLGDKEKAPELHRSSLKFLKVVVTCLDDNSLLSALTPEIISSMFALRKSKRFLV